MRSLLETMKAARDVTFVECRDDHLWYVLSCSVKHDGIHEAWSLTFRIPLADTAGGTFPAEDTKCNFYQRWIRKELELQQAEAEMIARARAEHEAEQEKP